MDVVVDQDDARLSRSNDAGSQLLRFKHLPIEKYTLSGYGILVF